MSDSVSKFWGRSQIKDDRMNLFTQQEPWNPWENPRQKVEFVVNKAGVEWRANLHENCFLSFATLSRSRTARISSLQLNLPNSENQIGNSDSRKRNDLYSPPSHRVVSISVRDANFSPEISTAGGRRFFITVDRRSIFWSIFRAYGIPLLNIHCVTAVVLSPQLEKLYKKTVN